MSILRAPLCPVTRVVLQPGIRMRIGVKSCEICAAIVLRGSHAPKDQQAGSRPRAAVLEIDRVETGCIRDGAGAAMGYPRFGMLDLLKLLSGLLVGLFRSHAARAAETAFLRQQLVVLKRSAPARLRLRTADRLIFVWLYRLC